MSTDQRPVLGAGAAASDRSAWMEATPSSPRTLTFTQRYILGAGVPRPSSIFIIIIYLLIKAEQQA